ncbi:putative quinol monooxygenase [Salegentibacter chungangensis]|uniref:Quinol monooxygenase n=1 Tax=Salegentibacter chungangensis TaxID=1335724 RepID=A0ABW3NWG7_9FLAO
MIKKGLLATVVAKEGKEKEVETFLENAVEMAKKEDKTIHWFAFKMDAETFGIFDTFEGEEGQKAHLNGEIAKKLMESAKDLLRATPNISKIDILAAK